MTYCLGMNLDAGLVLVSDSRTNAGVDNVGRFEKMRVFAREGDRVVVTLSAGNLSVTQNVLSLMEQRARGGGEHSLWMAESMYDIACLLGEAMREVQRRDGDYLRKHNIEASASFILAGQIRGESPRMFLVYTEGNFIETSHDTPFFQIGEIKYGKPILDRVIEPSTALEDAVKCALISFDSTMRSNISVGPPLDVLVYERDSLKLGLQKRLDEGDPYLQRIRQQWGEGLRRVFVELEGPEWGDPP
ncbi:proteasome-type protease [uncultured Aquimonas sp.]|jgi:putative proteasome-type protease|uniref:proteasome-type protease n=1 Tax=uncultured Aquimonas sp. TaxID=385483 RepID=UPI00086E7123|nr:proteasome-type protease [uncultured Aquimonas sp.]ODU46769.1 MAG: peptidase [Xanthomonadaceae bacterium SCN 69-123]